jgi:hypothetical protein
MLFGKETWIPLLFQSLDLDQLLLCLLEQKERTNEKLNSAQLV